jgi:hypothetical protein
MNVSQLLGADAFPPPAGDTIAATTAYRNLTSGGSQPVKTFIYSTSAALQAGTTVASVTLPTGSGGDIGIFAIGPPERARLAAPATATPPSPQPGSACNAPAACAIAQVTMPARA